MIIKAFDNFPGTHLLSGNRGDIFADQVLATAILDRLLHHSTTINIRGQSFRLREKRRAGVFQDLISPQLEGGPTYP